MEIVQEIRSLASAKGRNHVGSNRYSQGDYSDSLVQWARSNGISVTQIIDALSASPRSLPGSVSVITAIHSLDPTTFPSASLRLLRSGHCDHAMIGAIAEAMPCESLVAGSPHFQAFFDFLEGNLPAPDAVLDAAWDGYGYPHFVCRVVTTVLERLALQAGDETLREVLVRLDKCRANNTRFRFNEMEWDGVYFDVFRSASAVTEDSVRAIAQSQGMSESTRAAAQKYVDFKESNRRSDKRKQEEQAAQLQKELQWAAERLQREQMIRERRCLKCGSPLSFLDRLSHRVQHRRCS